MCYILSRQNVLHSIPSKCVTLYPVKTCYILSCNTLTLSTVFCERQGISKGFCTVKFQEWSVNVKTCPNLVSIYCDTLSHLKSVLWMAKNRTWKTCRLPASKHLPLNPSRTFYKTKIKRRLILEVPLFQLRLWRKLVSAILAIFFDSERNF